MSSFLDEWWDLDGDPNLFGLETFGGVLDFLDGDNSLDGFFPLSPQCAGEERRAVSPQRRAVSPQRRATSPQGARGDPSGGASVPPQRAAASSQRSLASYLATSPQGTRGDPSGGASAASEWSGVLPTATTFRINDGFFSPERLSGVLTGSNGLHLSPFIRVKV